MARVYGIESTNTNALLEQKTQRFFEKLFIIFLHIIFHYHITYTAIFETTDRCDTPRSKAGDSVLAVIISFHLTSSMAPPRFVLNVFQSFIAPGLFK